MPRLEHVADIVLKYSEHSASKVVIVLIVELEFSLSSTTLKCYKHISPNGESHTDSQLCLSLLVLVGVDVVTYIVYACVRDSVV